MSIVYYWRVYCTTDAKYEYVWSEDEPTTCPTDPVGHSINSADTSAIDQRDPHIVQIQEELVSTQGIYQFVGYETTIPAGTPGDVTPIDLVWPDYPITLMNGSFDAAADQIGDEISVEVAPNQIVGAITANVTASDTVINVSSTVLDNTYVGYRVFLFDGVNMDVMGICTAIDKGAGTITCKTGAVNAFSAVSPTYVMISVDVIKNLHIGAARTYEFAKKKVGGKAIPAGTVTRINYMNNDGVQKQFKYNIELMY